MKFRLSLMVLFNLSASLICEQTLLASVTDKEDEERAYDNPKPIKSSEFDKRKTGLKITGDASIYSFPREPWTQAASSIKPLSLPHGVHGESSGGPFDLSRSTPSCSPLTEKMSAEQEIDHFIKDMERLSFSERSFKEGEKAQSVWSRFPMEQIGELRQAIDKRSPSCIESMTMYVSNGPAKFLVIDAIPFPKLPSEPPVSRAEFFTDFFNLHYGEEIFTSPMSMYGEERVYGFSKDVTHATISFKLILRRHHVKKEEFLKFESYHPLEIELRTFAASADVSNSEAFCLTSVRSSEFKDDGGTIGTTDLPSISHSDLSIAHVEAHKGFVSVTYAYPSPVFDFDDTSQNIYDPATKAFRYFHIKLQPQNIT